MIALWLVGCRPVVVGEAEPDFASFAEYADACEAALGPVPAIDCDASTEIRVLVTDGSGETRAAATEDQLEDGERCDQPSTISGCVAGSRAGSVLTDGTAWHWVCRKNGWGTPDGLYDDVALIGHRPDTGATCFFGAATTGERHPSALPDPAEDDGFWADLPDLASQRCRECHDAEPTLVTPWIRPALDLAHSDPFGPVDLLGADQLEALAPGGWLPGPDLVHPDAGPCVACHRLTNRQSCTFSARAAGTLDPRASVAGQAWPRSHWMDVFDPAELGARYPTEADWDAGFGEAVAAIAECCAGERPVSACWGPR